MITENAQTTRVIAELAKDADFQKQFPLCLARLEKLINARVMDICDEEGDKATRIEACSDLLKLMRSIPAESDKIAQSPRRKRLNNPA